MAELVTIEQALPALFAQLMDIPCDWRGKAREMHTQARAQIDDLTSGSVGVDEVEIEDVDDAGEPVADPEDAVAVKETVHGLRERTIQVSVWSPRQTLDKSARFYLERLRTRLRFSANREALREMGLATVRIEPIVGDDDAQDGRRISSATMDIRFGHGHADSAAPVPFIETADITSVVTKADGTPQPPNFPQIDTEP